MIYYREKINSFTDAFHNYSVIVLVSQNYNLLQKEAQKISDTIAGTNADEEMRITRYFVGSVQMCIRDRYYQV